MAINNRSVCLSEKKVVEEFKGEPPQKITSWWSNHWRAILGEFVSTMLLIFLGCMTCVPIEGSVTTPLYSAIGFGLIVLFMAQCFAHISGSHMNPSVTLGAVILGKMPIPVAMGYVVAQCSGAIIGYGLLIELAPINILNDGICVNQPHLKHTIYQTLGIEIIFTAALMLIICALLDPVNEEKNETIAIKFGLTVAGLAIAGGPVAGVSMNPARSLGPAVWTARWAYHWVYWVGPLLGGAVSATFYKIVWLKKKDIKEQPILEWTDDNNEV